MEKLRWKDAQATNTISVYEDFIKKYPNTQYLSQAETSIEKIKWTGKKILIKDRIIIQGSSDNWLVNAMAKDMMQSKYTAIYEAIVEDVIGDSLKVIIKRFKVDMVTTNGMTSYAQHQYLGQAKDIASKNIGKTLAIEKSKAITQE